MLVYVSNKSPPPLPTLRSPCSSSFMRIGVYGSTFVDLGGGEIAAWRDCDDGNDRNGARDGKGGD